MESLSAFSIFVSFMQVELSSSLLVSILEVLCDRVTSEVKHEDAEQVCNILRCLSKSGRFSLTVRAQRLVHKPAFESAKNDKGHD